MKTKLLIVTAVLFALAAEAIPAVKILTPKRNARLTNGLVTATGTVKSTLPVTAVFYSFNGGDWAAAAGTTNWSVPNLAMTAGSNTLSIYATDTGGASLTNKVTFTYVVMLPISVLTNGNGMVTPDYNVRLLEIGRKYPMNAKAAKGFGFTGWTCNGEAITNGAHMFFVMQSNLTFTANFADNGRPLCVITYPAVKQSVSNSPITAICRASDNVGVTAVHYKLNGDAWESDASSSDGGTTWNIAGLALVAGTNTLRTFAEDAVGNFSMTNTVVFRYISNAPPVTGFAPASIAGMRGLVVGDMSDTQVKAAYEMTFGAATYGITSTNLEDEPEVGNYFYTVLDPNTVRLTKYSVSPVDQINYELKSHTFVFTNSTTAIFTNWDNSIGTMTFSPISNLVPSPSAILTVSYWDVSNPAVSNVSVLNGGAFTNYSNYGTGSQTATSWGTYSFMQFSPVIIMMRQNFTNPDDAGTTTYVLLTFDTTSSGGGYVASFDVSTNRVGASLAGFSIVSAANPPSGYAPMNLAGKLVTVSQSGTTFKVCFGDNTITVFDPNTNHDNANLEDYCFIKTGSNSGQLIQKLVFPPNESDLTSEDVVVLNFSSATAGTATTSQGTANLTIATANDWAPTALAGKSITSSAGGTGTFGDNGTFTFADKQGSETGSYDYAKFSPLGGVMILRHAGGGLSYLQFQMTSATAGQWYQTDFDDFGMVTSVDSGTFHF